MSIASLVLSPPFVKGGRYLLRIINRIFKFYQNLFFHFIFYIMFQLNTLIIFKTEFELETYQICSYRIMFCCHFRVNCVLSDPVPSSQKLTTNMSQCNLCRLGYVEHRSCTLLIPLIWKFQLMLPLSGQLLLCIFLCISSTRI